jgi:hypothetical protein
VLLPPSGGWLKGDLHVHSMHSHDAVQLGDDIAHLVLAAERAGLDFASISDHRSADCLSDPQFAGAGSALVLLAGEEWGGPGHAGAHGLTRSPIAHEQDEGQGPAVCVQKIEQVIADVHAMGGFFILNHPIDDRCPWYWPVDGFDGMEIWNQPWSFRGAYDVSPADIRKWMGDHGMTSQSGPGAPAEAFAAVALGGGGVNRQRLKYYEAYLASGRHIAAVGGGDSHYLILPGNPTTLVFASDRTPAAICEAVRKGRTMVARAPDAPVLEFTADRDGDGIFESIVGDSLPLGRAVTFKIHVRDAEDGKLELVKNGRIIQQWQVTGGDFEVTYADAAATPSWYRVNCYERLDMSVPNARLLRQLVLGTANLSFLNTLSSGLLGGVFGWIGSFAGHVQDIVDTGGPALVWLLLFGDQAGVHMAPIPTRYPRLELPEGVSRILNVCVEDDDYCPGVFTSPIWVE